MTLLDALARLTNNQLASRSRHRANVICRECEPDIITHKH